VSVVVALTGVRKVRKNGIVVMRPHDDGQKKKGDPGSVVHAIIPEWHPVV
jgi:hypothetical protein